MILKNEYFDSFSISEHVANKKKQILDAWARSFIGSSTLLFIATSDQYGGIYISPRGGDLGFSAVISDDEIQFQDKTGNRLFETFRNILNGSQVGMIFLIPGMAETLRIQGAASLRREEPEPDNETGVVVTIKVSSWYYHCSRAFKKGAIWDTKIIEMNKSFRPVGKRPVFRSVSNEENPK